jgi:hypothetical protein
MALTNDQAATVSAEMAAQRSAELAGDEAHYRLKRACVTRAVELFGALRFSRRGDGRFVSIEEVDQLLKEIEHDAQ